MSLEPRYRYPGLEPFSTEQKDLFFGREADLERLHAQVTMHQQVLLYAKSGLGKSSLINAGLVPLLAEQAGVRILPIRIGTWVNPQSHTPLAAVHQALPEMAATYLDKIIVQEGSIWYHFKADACNTQAVADAVAPTYYLLFDQFEEIFSHPEESIFAFKKQMADLLYRAVPQHFRAILDIRQGENAEILSPAELRQFYQPLQIKVLYAIREDRYYELNRLADYLPDLLQHRFLLAPLDRAAAQASIERPAALVGNFVTPAFAYTPDAIRKIIDYLSAGQQQTVETTQLQVLCSHIERLGKALVHAVDIPEFNDIFLQFYLDSIAALAPEDRQRAREFIEEYLIIERQRIAYHKLACLERIPERALDLLLRERHLLRTERSSTGGISYELSHDTLVAPILMAKAKREAEELQEAEAEERLRAEQARVAQEEKRAAEEKALREELEKEQAARKHELQLLAVAQAAREGQQRQLKRARIFLVCAGLAAVLALLAYLYAQQQTKIAEREKATAEIQKEKAVAATVQARQAEQAAKQAYKRLSDGQIDQLADKHQIVAKLDPEAARYLVDSMWKIDSTNPYSISLHQKYYPQ